MKSKYPKDFIDLLKSIVSKRPRIVIDHILEHGFITTEELKNIYGYNHPPRAVRDAREHGVPIETFRVVGSDGRKIAAYKFAQFTKSGFSRLSGRTILSKKIKQALVDKYGNKDFIYGKLMSEAELQIDHRIPFEIAGDIDVFNPDNFMLLSGSANREKSWNCEHCINWKKIKDQEICLSCYWAYPENYTHIAMKEIRRIDLIWQEKEVAIYEAVRDKANKVNKEIQEVIKEMLKRAVENKK